MSALDELLSPKNFPPGDILRSEAAEEVRNSRLELADLRTQVRICCGDPRTALYDELQRCRVEVSDMWKERDKLEVEVDALRAKIRHLEADAESYASHKESELADLLREREAAAGECCIPVPEVGSDVGKLLMANRLLLADNAKLRCAALERHVDFRNLEASCLEYCDQRNAANERLSVQLDKVGVLDERAGLLAACLEDAIAWIKGAGCDDEPWVKKAKELLGPDAPR